MTISKRILIPITLNIIDLVTNATNHSKFNIVEIKSIRCSIQIIILHLVRYIEIITGELSLYLVRWNNITTTLLLHGTNDKTFCIKYRAKCRWITFILLRGFLK